MENDIEDLRGGDPLRGVNGIKADPYTRWCAGRETLIIIGVKYYRALLDTRSNWWTNRDSA